MDNSFRQQEHSEPPRPRHFLAGLEILDGIEKWLASIFELKQARSILQTNIVNNTRPSIRMTQHNDRNKHSLYSDR
jgi:hypothetical protein